MSQKLDANDLSENSTNGEDDILSEYKKTTNTEGRQDSSLSGQDVQTKAGAKASEIHNDQKNIDENITNANKGSPNLGGGGGSLIEIIFYVLMAAIKAAQEDLKKFAGKIKTVNKAEMNSLAFQYPAKTTSLYNFLVNAVKKLQGGQKQITENMKDGDVDGEDQQRTARVNEFGIKARLSNRTTILGVLLAIGILIGTVVTGLILGKPKLGQVEHKPPENNPLELILITPNFQKRSDNPLELVLVTPSISECSIAFKSPLGTEELPNFGPVLFEWTNVPTASSYILKVTPPAEASLPWGYAVQENSKKIYMENFPMGGEFSISIHALSNSGTVLCSATLRYTKDEYVKQSGGNPNKAGQDDQGSSSDEPASTPCVTTGFGYFCP